MSDAPVAASVGAADLVQVLQAGGIVLATAGQIWAIRMAQCSSLGAAVSALSARVAVLDGRPDPNQVFAASLPVATLQAGSVDVSLSVPGLLRGDAIAVEVAADLPGGLALGAIRPDPARDGVLVVQATATLSLAGASPIPLKVTTLR